MQTDNDCPETQRSALLQHNAGFTLVEIVVVVTLISLFMFLSVPLFSALGANDLDTSARRISGTIKYLYNESAMSGSEYRLIYDLNTGSYRALVHGAGGEVNKDMAQGREARLKGDVQFLDVQLPGRGKFTEGQVTTRILPTGWIDETIIHLSDGKNNLLTLKVVPLTGITEVFEGYREF
ncbi:MAG: prepilin-type N-terminal cleavage/methylation domain-containing protein [Deltaproteobacteria bacterium]|jgi:general secretion pathway protein H|nr:prepilin-type N-terminal cleavage/methylation domain-containing protein [Deltaproteobacteria bacterium]